MSPPIHVFVAAAGNEFMRDIGADFVEAARQLGRTASLVTDRLPDADGSINFVVAPHEFFVLSDAPVADLKRAAAASVCICTEQPNTPWFHLSLDACQRGLLSFDINEHGTAALRHYGVNAHRLPFGAVPSMTAGVWPERDLDLLFMGSLDPRRGRALASLAPLLWNRHSELRLFPFDKPVTPGTPGVVFGREKYELLRRSKVLANVHRDRSTHLPPGTEQPAYFEWVRMVEAMANGCVVVTEPSEGYEPLVPGTHFVSVEVEDMADAIEALLADPARLESISCAAREAVTRELPLSATLATALAMVEADVLPRLAGHVAGGAHQRGTWRLREGGAQGPKRLPAFRPYADVLSRAKQIALAESDTLRRLEAVHALLQHSTEQHIHRTETPAYTAAVKAAARGVRPDVSVLVTLYDYESLVAETLDSILASTDVSIEVVIVEDHATDNSREVARRYLAAHPDAAMLLLAKDANEGLAAARNSGIQVCRADYVMIMDADNLVYPTCLRRLADALDNDPGAAFAYAALEEFGAAAHVRSAYAWNPEWLCAANYIDAQTMIRRSVLQSLGGYRLADPMVFGWEDWEMWLRLASRGDRGVLVPEMLGRYRVQAGSMIGLTNLSVDESLAHLRALHPTLPWPAVA